MVNKISEEDREYIISQFSPSVEEGAEKDVLDYVRGQLEIRFCPEKYSSQQVNAVCSQVIIQRNKSKKILAHEASSSSSSNHDNESVKKVNEVETIISTSEIGEVYRNERKEKWFKQWLEFIVQSSTPEWRKEAFVITLAGPLCLRLSDYIQAGFSPCNIIAVEGGSAEEKNLFERNLPDEVQKRLDRLENFIHGEKIKFGVVDYDFLGPVNDTYLEILRHTPIADHAFVLVNVMGRRENARTQEILKCWNNDLDNAKMLKANNRKFEFCAKKGRQESPEEAAAVIKEAEKYANNVFGDIEDCNLSEARMNVIASLFTRAIGAERLLDDNLYLQKIMNAFTDTFGNPATTDLVRFELHDNACMFLEMLKVHLNYHGAELKTKTDLLGIIGLILRCVFRSKLIKSMNKVHYQSEKSGTPYFSIFTELVSPDAMLSSCSEIRNFILKFIEQTSIVTLMRQKNQDVTPYIDLGNEPNQLTRSFRRAGKKSPLMRADNLHVLIDGMSCAKIKGGKFFDELNLFNKEMSDNWNLTFTQDQVALPWQKII